VTKYVKMVTQLEKGLPPNGVVPKLKAKVKDMQEKVIVFVHKCACYDTIAILSDASDNKPTKSFP